MKLLVVDDNKSRMLEIKNLLSEKLELSENDIYMADNTQEAKGLLRNICFDFLILDVVLPKRNEIPNAKFGLLLLNEIKNRPAIKKPGKIVGITAHIDDIELFRKEFDSHCEVLIEASTKNKEWKGILLKAIEFEFVRQASNYTSKNKVMCITVHGIRTKGTWQEKLKKIMESRVDNLDFHAYKYGYFTVISFFIPFLRNVKIKHFSDQLENIIHREGKDKEIIFFCHSFGSYIAIKAINDFFLNKNKNINIRLIVLAGSVLPSNFDLGLILEKTNAKIVNDCGSNDKVLLLSELLVPNTGMAGRIGFYGLNNNRFVNRFFKGGHSHFFEHDTFFMEKHWVPLIGNSSTIEVVDQRNNDSILSVVIEKTISTIGKFKEVLYVFLLVYILYLFFCILN
ncbi:TPA: response regulator [Providencia alcalifaciens]